MVIRRLLSGVALLAIAAPSWGEVGVQEDAELHVPLILRQKGELLFADFELTVGKSYRLTFWVKVRNVPRWRPVVATHDLPAILHNAFRAPDGDSAVLLWSTSAARPSAAD